MTKQEEIRENLAEVLSFSHEPDEPEWAEMDEHKKRGYRNESLNILSYLHSQGVVIKVEGMGEIDISEAQKMRRNGITNIYAVEPLIDTP